MFKNLSKGSSKSRGLRTKAIVLAIALGTIPVLLTGLVAYYSTHKLIREQVIASKKSRAIELADRVNRFIFERYADIQVLANLPIITDERVINIVSLQQKQQVLDRFVKAYRVYDNIAVFDINGNLIVKSTSGDASGNPKNRNYFQQVLKTASPVITDPELSKSTGELVIHFAAPVKDVTTGKIIGIIRARLPKKYIEETIELFNTNGDSSQLIDSSGLIFQAVEAKEIGEEAQEEYPTFKQMLALGEPISGITFSQTEQKELLVAIAPIQKLERLPQLKWIAIIETDPKIAFAASDRLLLTIAIGTGGTAIIVALVAIFLSISITEPLIKRIGSVVNLIVNSSSEIASTVEQQERMATQQATSVNETTITMDELGASSRASAEIAAASAVNTGQVLALAKQGTASVARTQEGMYVLKEKIEAIAQQILQLSQNTGEIGKISTLVSDLASQTNMLALNAAVEAARAGTQGKGFAVVAAEIRKLADQSKKSAQKINTQVNDIQNAINLTVMVTKEGTKTVEDGVKFAHSTTEAFAGVAEAINDVVLSSQQISLNVQQQTSAIQQVVDTMNALNISAQETASGISQTKLATQKLNEAALNLKTVV